MQFDCHPEQAFFAQRRACPELDEGIWASRAFALRLLQRNNRALGSLPYQTAPLP
jgi:hypothetical protein